MVSLPNHVGMTITNESFMKKFFSFIAIFLLFSACSSDAASSSPTGAKNSAQPLGLPYWEPVLRSRMAAVILGTQHEETVLKELLNRRFSLKNELPQVDFFLENCRQVCKNGYIAYREFGRGWSVNFPVWCNAHVYGVSLFGQDAEHCNLERMIFETSLLASRLTSALDEHTNH